MSPGLASVLSSKQREQNACAELIPAIGRAVIKLQNEPFGKKCVIGARGDR
jgi:hypothetical protein